MSRSVMTLFAAAMLMGCGSEGGKVNPAPAASPEAGVLQDAGPDATQDAPAEAGEDAPIEVRRTILQRNPFGNYAESGNLLLDGDFEWAGMLAVQYPWFKYPSLGPMAAPDIQRGPICRSGMSCVRIQPGAAIAGFGVNPPEGKSAIAVTLWLRATTGEQCPGATVSLEGCFLDTEPQTMVMSDDPPEADGWCRRTGTVTVPDDTPCLFITALQGPFNTLYVDDVVMKAAPEGAKLVRAESSAAHRASVTHLRKVARGMRHPKKPALPQLLRGKVR